MRFGSWLRLGAAAIALALAVSVFVAWRTQRREQVELQQRLNAAEKELHAANAREEARRVELQQQLDKIAQQKRTVQKPEQVIQALPEVLPLPAPLKLEPVPSGSSKPGQGTSGGLLEPPPPKVAVPTEDLKPLYDYALGCQACQAQLTTAQADLKDEQVKVQALGRERDDALRAVKGGSTFKRVLRAAKWFVIGAAAGAVAAKCAH